MQETSFDSKLAMQAYKELFSDDFQKRDIRVRYSAKFKGLNANVKYSKSFIEFSLSRDWLEFSNDLKKGVFQHLFIKMNPKKEYNKTFSLDLYEKFLANLEKYAKVHSIDSELEESFERINKVYFEGLMEKPNLVWGQKSFRKLGHFEYYTNTVVISSIFKGVPELTDYIMYHELLHKKHGGKKTKSGRTIHHSTAFRKEEALFEDKNAEKKLNNFLRRKKFLGIFRSD